VSARTAALLRRDPQTPVLVKADTTVPYGTVAHAMVLLQRRAHQGGLSDRSRAVRRRGRSAGAGRALNARFLREHSWPVLFSVLLHGALAAALVLMTLVPTHSPASMQPAPINATVVDSQILHAPPARARGTRRGRRAGSARRGSRRCQGRRHKRPSASHCRAQPHAAEEAHGCRGQSGGGRKGAEAAKAAEQARPRLRRQPTALPRRRGASRSQARRRGPSGRKPRQPPRPSRRPMRSRRPKRRPRRRNARRISAPPKEREAGRIAAADGRGRARGRGRGEPACAIAMSRVCSNRIQNAWIKPPSARVGRRLPGRGDAGAGRRGHRRASHAVQRRCGGSPVHRECGVSCLAAARSAGSGPVPKKFCIQVQTR
jgi:colicin import membrane protein